MELTAVIACKDRRHNLEYNLASIAGGEYIPKTVVVDFGSKEPLTDLAQKYSFVKLIHVTKYTETFHKARAVNIGIRNVTTPLLCVTDADQVFAPNFFNTVRGVLTSQRAFVLCLTYAVYALPLDITPDNIVAEYPRLLELARNTRSVYGDGCCHGVRSIDMVKMGGYEESFKGWGGEDTDMTWRAHKHWKLPWVQICGKTSMIHLPHGTVATYHSPDMRKRNLTRLHERIRNRERYGNHRREWGKL